MFARGIPRARSYRNMGIRRAPSTAQWPGHWINGGTYDCAKPPWMSMRMRDSCNSVQYIILFVVLPLSSGTWHSGSALASHILQLHEVEGSIPSVSILASFYSHIVHQNRRQQGGREASTAGRQGRKLEAGSLKRGRTRGRVGMWR
jgi:hypothetical protein